MSDEIEITEDMKHAGALALEDLGLSYSEPRHGRDAAERVLRAMLSKKKLPQMDDLVGIDITGGMDSVEYVRQLRDGYSGD